MDNKLNTIINSILTMCENIDTHNILMKDNTVLDTIKSCLKSNDINVINTTLKVY